MKQIAFVIALALLTLLVVGANLWTCTSVALLTQLAVLGLMVRWVIQTGMERR